MELNAEIHDLPPLCTSFCPTMPHEASNKVKGRWRKLAPTIHSSKSNLPIPNAAVAAKTAIQYTFFYKKQFYRKYSELSLF